MQSDYEKKTCNRSFFKQSKTLKTKANLILQRLANGKAT